MKTYAGIDQDHFGGMTPIGTIVKDAWLFGILPETETCAGWTHDRLQMIYDQVSTEWAQYGHRVANLPPELRERHERIHAEAMRRARELGWEPDLAHEDD